MSCLNIKNSWFSFLTFCFFGMNMSCNQEEKTSILEDKTIATSNVEFKNEIERIEPMNWWVGFKNTNLQLLVKHPNISKATPNISYAGVSIKKVNKAHSPNYLFIDLNISKETKPGQFNIVFKFKNGSELTQTYELKSRKKPAEAFVGFDSSDVIYLITPDRFANGNFSNDTDKELLEKGIDRENNYARHGGDIKGIIQHLDYIENMGFTAIWPCPLLTNDMASSSYHGYAMT